LIIKDSELHGITYGKGKIGVSFTKIYASKDLPSFLLYIFLYYAANNCLKAGRSDVPPETSSIYSLVVVWNRLKQVRKEKGFDNYEHIAYELGMSRSAYWRLESGENFSIKTLVKVCKLLGVTFEEFFTEVDVPKVDKKKKKK
jgi:DNA-binding XRE family transcriptional regulator